MRLRDALYCGVLLVVTACMTWQPVQAGTEATRPSHLRVTTSQGVVHDLTQARVFSDSVTGYTGRASTYTSMPASSVTRIERRRISPIRSLLLAGGVGIVLAAVVGLGWNEESGGY